MMASKVEFEFRIWVHPVDGDPPGIEVWFSGLEATESGRGSVTDWATEVLSNEDLYALFDIDEDEDKHWQVFGKGTLRGSYDYFGDYDEDFSVVEYTKAEVPHEWLYGKELPLDESA